MTPQTNSRSTAHLEVRFESLFRPGSGMSFPCDERGKVDLDALPQRARLNYLFARAMIGREYTTPAVVLVA